ncbi:hypothetical protein ALC53_04049 [Atta colombica]|uniref:Uncharacterized protein n=1 Tax=Atta colombica TaxID=520822 RepID=A0A195BLL0_9HYME|nr:hypothetical protein ALC53_04049 [Atta colombica]
MTGYYQSHPTARLVHLFLFWGCEHDAFTYTEVQRSPGFSFPHNRVTTKHGYQIKSCYRLHYGGKGRNCAVLLSPS